MAAARMFMVTARRPQMQNRRDASGRSDQQLTNVLLVTCEPLAREPGL
jgi:hypothetical protein